MKKKRAGDFDVGDLVVMPDMARKVEAVEMVPAVELTLEGGETVLYRVDRQLCIGDPAQSDG